MLDLITARQLVGPEHTYQDCWDRIRWLLVGLEDDVRSGAIPRTHNNIYSLGHGDTNVALFEIT